MNSFFVQVWSSVHRVATWSIALAISALAAQAQVRFSAPINVSNNAGNSQFPQIAVDAQGNINLVWLDNSPGNFSVFFSQSSDSGVTFSRPLNLSNNPGGPALFPQMGVDSGGDIYVAWFDSNSGNASIFFSRSTDGGATFSTPVSASAVAGPVLLAVDPTGKVYVAWARNDSSGVARLVFSRSLDRGATFTSPLAISNASVTAIPGAIALDASGNINVAWTEAVPPQGLSNVYFSRSTDSGASFSSPSPVTNSSGPMFRVAGLTVDRLGSIHVLWTSTSGGQTDAYLSHSSDGGTAFIAENFQSGVSDAAQSPQLAADSHGGINVLWHAGDTNPSVNLAHSVDEGATFSTQTVAGSDFSNPSSPWIAADAIGNIDVLWSQSSSPTVQGGLMFARSANSGQTFSAHQQVSTVGGQNVTATVDSGGNIYAVWSQLVSNGNGDIFFSRSTTSGSAVASQPAGWQRRGRCREHSGACSRNGRSPSEQ